MKKALIVERPWLWSCQDWIACVTCSREFTSKLEERQELEKEIRALTSDANVDKEAVEITEEASDVDAEVAEVKQTKASNASEGTKAKANVEKILDGHPTLPDQEWNEVLQVELSDLCMDLWFNVEPRIKSILKWSNVILIWSLCGFLCQCSKNLPGLIAS